MLVEVSVFHFVGLDPLAGHFADSDTDPDDHNSMRLTFKK